MSPADESAVGLCARCVHDHAQQSARGSTFHRCLRADVDPSYPRYPPLPVLACRGFEPVEAADEAGRGARTPEGP